MCLVGARPRECIRCLTQWVVMPGTSANPMNKKGVLVISGDPFDNHRCPNTVLVGKHFCLFCKEPL